MQHDLKILARSQIAMGEAITQLVEAQEHADQSMNALIRTVDEIIRGPQGAVKPKVKVCSRLGR